MQNLNHRVWGRQFSKNQIIALFTATVFAGAILSLFISGITRNITVFYDDQCQVVSSCHSNPHLILQKAGISLSGGEEYELEETVNGAVLRVGPEFQVSVSVDGTLHQIASRTDRVENILANLGIKLGEDDIVSPALDTIVTEDCTIEVGRVTYANAVRKEAVEPTVVYEDTDCLPKGTTSVKDPGVPGVAQVSYEDMLIDGKIAQSTPLSTVVTKEAKDKIVLRGTADRSEFSPVVTTNADLNDQLISELEPETPILVNDAGVPVAYKECITGTATAYTARDGKQTSTGEVAQVGYIAVDPEEIPYGTMMYIKTADDSYFYGYAKAADTGGFISGSVAVDLFFETESECIQFGVRDVEIYIL